MTGPVTPGQDVALFIDWENFKISLATGRRTPNVSALKEEVSNLGRVVVAKAYADWVTRPPEIKGASQFINDPPALYAAGIEPVYVPTRLSWGDSSSNSMRHTRVKNSVDVKMTADCIECAHSYANISTFVLVSGDSDFIHVVNLLRTMGKRVVIIGVSWATSRRLADQVDGLILYDVDIDPVSVAAPALEPVQPVQAVQAGSERALARPAAALVGAAGATTSKPELSAVISEIEEIIRTERQAGGTPLLTSIKQRLMRRFPSFDEKQYGYSGFKKLMARVAQEGNIKLITAGLVDWATMADEEVPPEAEVVSPESVDSQETAAAAAEAVEEAPSGRGRRRRSPIARFRRSEEAAEPSDPPAESPEIETPVSLDSQQDQQTPEPEPAEEPEVSPSTPVLSPQLEELLAEAAAGLDLPEGPDDGQNSQRIADLIVMADTLEHREGISHVAFNFLVAEVCQALEQGLEAEYGEITNRWAGIYSKGYISKLFRGLSNASLFQRGWHSWRDETTGQYRRRRTFNLDRNHPVVEGILKDRLAPAGNGTAGEVTPPAQVWEDEFHEDDHSHDTNLSAEAPDQDLIEAPTDAPPEEDNHSHQTNLAAEAPDQDLLEAPTNAPPEEDNLEDTEEAANSAVSFFSRLFRAKNEG